MADRIGQRLGNYTLVKLLGQGGFAEVYLGEHLYLKSQAAIKILQARLSSSDDTDNFLREAQTIARLAHPNIVRVLDFGTTEETPYLVMDYAPNGTLRQRHQRHTALPLVTIVPYVKQIADALQYAHDERIIHRDIKPENMLIGRRNEILLSDFGIALVAQSSRYQGTQDVIGTVAYMSPEQIQGRPRPASDQYSLGIVVYEWLTGDRPFTGSFTELCTQHMFAAPPALNEKLPLVSPDIERVLLKALDKDPKQRFETIQQFAQALEAASGSAQTVEMRTDSPSTSYNTVAQTSFTTQPAALTNQSAVTPNITAQPSLSQSTPSSSSPHLTTGNQGANSQRATPQPQAFGPGQSNTQKPTEIQTPNPSATMHSSETVAQTRGNAFAPQQGPGQFAQGQGSNPANQFAQQKVILPSQPGHNQPPVQQGYQPQQPIQTDPYRQTGYPQERPQPFQQQGQYPHTPPAQGYGQPQHFAQPQPQQYPPQAPQPMQQAQAQFGQQQAPAYQSQPPRAETPSSFAQQRAEPEQSHSQTRTEPGESWDSFLGLSGTAKWRIAATIVGIILFCLAHDFSLSVYNYRIPFLLVIPIFFGASFGPIVGLLVALGGVAGCGLLFPNINTFGTLNNVWWFPYALYAAAGGLSGLAVVFRKKLYPSIGTSIRSCLLSFIGLAIIFGFIHYQSNNLKHLTTISVPVLVGFAASLIALIIYSLMARLVDPS